MAIRVLTPDEQKISDDAYAHVRAQKRVLIEKYAGADFPPAHRPIAVYMAGSPGAGKTELSKSLITLLQTTQNTGPIVRIDGDEIRTILPGYTGANSYIFQRAISLGVSKLHDHVLDKKKNFLMDGTFSNQEKANENVGRAIAHGFSTTVVYAYQEPTIAWKFTQKRELAEGRNIPKEAFINGFMNARISVQKVKERFGSGIELWLFDRNLETREEKNYRNVVKIDDFIPKTYSKEELEKLI